MRQKIKKNNPKGYFFNYASLALIFFNPLPDLRALAETHTICFLPSMITVFF